MARSARQSDRQRTDGAVPEPAANDAIENKQEDDVLTQACPGYTFPSDKYLVVSKRNAQGDLEVWVARIPHSQRIVWAAVIRRHKRGSKEGWQPVFVSAQVGETVSEGLGNLDDYNKNLPKRDAPAVRDLRIGLRSSAAYAYTRPKQWCEGLWALSMADLILRVCISFYGSRAVQELINSFSAEQLDAIDDIINKAQPSPSQSGTQSLLAKSPSILSDRVKVINVSKEQVSDLVQGLAKDSENAPSKSQKEGVPSYAAVTRSDGTGKARPASEGSQGQVQTSKEGEGPRSAGRSTGQEASPPTSLGHSTGQQGKGTTHGNTGPGSKGASGSPHVSGQNGQKEKTTAVTSSQIVTKPRSGQTTSQGSQGQRQVGKQGPSASMGQSTSNKGKTSPVARDGSAQTAQPQAAQSKRSDGRGEGRSVDRAAEDVAKPADVVPHEGDGTVNEPVNPAVASLIDNSEEYELMQVKDADENDLGLCGLRNEGCTCYGNAILQQLYLEPKFVAELQSRDYNARRLDGKPEDRYATGRALAIELLMTLELMAVCNGVLRLRRFWKAYYNATKKPEGHEDYLTFDAFLRNAEDSYVFFSTLQDRVDGYMEDTGQAGVFTSVFGGVERRTIFGVKKEVLSKGTEISAQISVEVVLGRGEDATELKDLASGLQAYVAPEAMTGPNQYKIEPGNRYVDAYKQMTLDQPPDELVIQLKRVDFDFIAGRRYKFDNKYKIPFVLDLRLYMTSWVEPPGSHDAAPIQPELYRYELRGVVRHGGGVEGFLAHNTSYALVSGPDGPIWVLFDDGLVRKHGPWDERLEKACFGGVRGAPNAVMLRYTRVPGNPPGTPQAVRSPAQQRAAAPASPAGSKLGSTGNANASEGGVQQEAAAKAAKQVAKGSRESTVSQLVDPNISKLAGAGKDQTLVPHHSATQGDELQARLRYTLAALNAGPSVLPSTVPQLAAAARTQATAGVHPGRIRDAQLFQALGMGSSAYALGLLSDVGVTDDNTMQMKGLLMGALNALFDASMSKPRSLPAATGVPEEARGLAPEEGTMAHPVPAGTLFAQATAAATSKKGTTAKTTVAGQTTAAGAAALSALLGTNPAPTLQAGQAVLPAPATLPTVADTNAFVSAFTGLPLEQQLLSLALAEQQLAHMHALQALHGLQGVATEGMVAPNQPGGTSPGAQP